MAPPFDPSKLPIFDDAGRPVDDGAAAEEGAPWSVSELCRRVRGALQRGLPAQVKVTGQVSGFADRTHWWFSLKDEQAVVHCAMFASQARRCRFTPEDGQEVVATGRVDHYAKQGRTQLYVDALVPVGVGALELAYRRLVAELEAKGWFDPARKKPIPAVPRALAVVTSRSGAALQDVLDTLRRRAPFIDVLVVDVRVQGEAAAGEIARAIRLLSQRRDELGLDAIILTRGGGSMEDLWAFNERIVAKAVHECALPVVAAIGHEVDVTIAELVADARAATPTQAAMRASPDRAALQQQLDAAASRMSAALSRRLRLARAQLEGLASRPSLAQPLTLLTQRRQRLQRAAEVLRAAARRRLDAAQAQLGAVGGRLEAVNPHAVLARGYSLTTDERGRPLTDAAQLRAGQRVRTQLARGAFESTVERTVGAAPLQETSASQRPRSEDAAPKTAPGLFDDPA